MSAALATLRWCMTAAAVLACVPALDAQQLLDRVVARLGVTPILLSDVRAAIGFGLLAGRQGASPNPASTSPADPSAEEIDRAVQGLVDRHLALREVARFPPPDPTDAEIEIELARMKAHAGARLEDLLRSTGLDEARLRELARETLRVQAYIDQRFGTSVQVSDDEVRRYYDTHPDEFRRETVLIPFPEAEQAARQRAAEERLRASVSQWLADLRARAEIVVTR